MSRISVRLGIEVLLKYRLVNNVTQFWRQSKENTLMLRLNVFRSQISELLTNSFGQLSTPKLFQGPRHIGREGSRLPLQVRLLGTDGYQRYSIQADGLVLQ